MAERGQYSKGQIDAIRARTKISDIVGRFVQWDRKKSAPSRGDYWGCCPFHGEKRPSFHADDRRQSYHCFGCGAGGDVFRFLMEKTGCTFPEAVAQLGGEIDIKDESPEEKRRREKADRDRAEAQRREREKLENDVRAWARQIWQETVPMPGTLAEAYLRHRGIDFPVDQFRSIRFHPHLKYKDQKGKVWGNFPALVAGVQGPGDEFLGIWRIFLDPDGRKNSTVPDAKLGLGAYTEAGGGVRLGDPVGRVNVCEGIETGFGIIGITGGPVIAALNTSGMVNLRPPADASAFLIWPDGDVDRIRRINDQERTIESPGHRAAKELRDRMDAYEFPCGIQPTPKNGTDYLDTYNKMKKRKGR